MYDHIKDLAEAKGIIAEQDRLIGELTRKNNYMTDSECKHNEWLSQAKKEAGFNNNTSFDNVWAATLKAYNATLIKCTAQNCNANSIGDYNGHGEFACEYHMKKWNDEFDREYQ